MARLLVVGKFLTLNEPVAYLGPEGTYSHLAVLQFQPHSEWHIPCATIDQVFAAILTDRATCGLVPLYNSNSGLVSDTAESIIGRLLGLKSLEDQAWWKQPLCVSGSLPLQVNHCLVGYGERSSIQRVISKQQAIDQCLGWLQRELPDVVVEATDSSAAALQELQADPKTAAISSLQAARSARVPVLAQDIQDQSNNVTEFVVVQRDDRLGYQPYTHLPSPTSFVEYWVHETQPTIDQTTTIWQAATSLAGRNFWIQKVRTSERFTAGESVTCEREMPDGRTWRLGVASDH